MSKKLPLGKELSLRLSAAACADHYAKKETDDQRQIKLIVEAEVHRTEAEILRRKIEIRQELKEMQEETAPGSDDKPYDPKVHAFKCPTHRKDKPIEGSAEILLHLDRELGFRISYATLRRRRQDQENPAPVWNEGKTLYALPCRLDLWGSVKSREKAK
jgi:hypothetical protein